MRPRLWAIVETEDGFDDRSELLGNLNHALPTAIGSAWVLVALQFDAEGLVELGYSARQHEGAARGMLLHDAEPVRVCERLHRGKIRGTRAVCCCEGSARQRRARSIPARQT